MEASILVEALKGLLISGPVSTVLGILCYALWKQNQRREARIERQHEQMLKLAVRVQRAVEVLASIERAPTEVEKALDDTEKRRRKEDEEEDDEV